MFIPLLGFTLVFLQYTFCHHDARLFKDGDVILGGLFDLHLAAEKKNVVVNLTQ